MQSSKCHDIAILLAVLIFTFSFVTRLQGRQRASEVAPAKVDVFVIPFSHLDLFWAGTREECLARGNRIIGKALQIARQLGFRQFEVMPALNDSPKFIQTLADLVLKSVDGGR